MTPTDPHEASVHGQTTVTGTACEFITPGSLAPCTLVIFGASGDLTARKLIPASKARLMISIEVSSSVGPPKFMAPKHNGVTITPVLPNDRRPEATAD